MKLQEAIKYIAANLDGINQTKATGRFIITIDTNQGGIGAVEMFKADKAAKEKIIYISKKGIDFLEKI